MAETETGPAGVSPRGARAEARAPARAPERGALGLSYGPNVRQNRYSAPVVCVREDDIGRTFTYTDTPGAADGPLPPLQVGTRATKRLSRRAARQIRGAAVKAARMGRPLASFWTATFRPDARELIACGAITPGREIARLTDALSKWAKRNGRPAPVFVWVAENPHDDNPHVHLLTDLVIPRAEFRDFAAYLEELWGHGMVHMERIKHPYAAGGYILKAVNYCSKGAESAEQGTVYGNRYGISQRIRCTEVTTILDGTESEAAELRRYIFESHDTGTVERAGRLVSEYGVWAGGGGLDGVLDFMEVLACRVEQRERRCEPCT